MSSEWITGLYLIANIVIVYVSTLGISKAYDSDNAKAAKICYVLGLTLNVGMLVILKYSNFFINNVNAIANVFRMRLTIPSVTILAPIGVSFYTLTGIGYMTDCYWKSEKAQSNVFKLALFIGYFPQLTSGPITRYSAMKDRLYSNVDFNAKNILFGLQRIIWGLFKKLVIASRAGMIVDGIYNEPDRFKGLYIWIAAITFMIQLYADFSGCMDIIMGVSECYGIELPENFRTPFFSTSVQEYWQRWHITLGEWLKDYILYPILRTKTWTQMGKKIKNKYGKKASKQIPTYLGMLCVWLLIGLWHGGNWKYIIGMGLWFWMLIVINQLLKPLYIRLMSFLSIDNSNFSFRLFMAIKVFIFASIGNMFFRLSSLKNAIMMIRNGVSTFNPWVIFDGSIYSVGITPVDLNIIILGIVFMLVVAIIQEKHISARKWISEQIFLFRWIIWLGLIVLILVYGAYGPGYNAADFIYKAF